MKTKPSLLALAMLTGFSPAWANAPAPLQAPVPIGSPADWIDPGDYPATALRYDMTGVTAFRLAVDPEGRPTRCDIATSSGFDVLDKATCERLMTRARFSPSRGGKVGTAERAYVGRVRWVMPEDVTPPAPVSERFGRLLLSFDPAGKLSSCRMVIDVPIAATPPPQPPCKLLEESMPPAFTDAVKGTAAGSQVEAELQTAITFTPELRARVLATRPGYEQLALSVHRFTVTKEGTLGKCIFEEQRGIESMIGNNCMTMDAGKFDPPFSAFDKDGIATGWQITRALLKTGR